VTDRRKFTLPSRIESVEEAAQETERFARDNGVGEESIVAIDMAVREAMANAVKHGNKLDESKLVEVTLDKDPAEFRIVVRDFGAGFSADEVPDPTNPENLLKASGRGILFMRTFMDEVEWSEPPGGGIAVKMLKKL
jgi:serine/threonine-protein kinase RsbW